MSREGKVFYENLPASYSGPFNRATMQQEAEALDLRNIEVRRELRSLFPALLGTEYVTLPGTETFDASALPEGTDFAEAGSKLCRVLR